MRGKNFLFLGILFVLIGIFLVNSVNADYPTCSSGNSAGGDCWMTPPSSSSYLFCGTSSQGSVNPSDCPKTADKNWSTAWTPIGQDSSVTSILTFNFLTSATIHGVRFKPTWTGYLEYQWSSRPTASISYWTGSSFNVVSGPTDLDYMTSSGTLPIETWAFTQHSTLAMQLQLTTSRFCSGTWYCCHVMGCSYDNIYDGLYEISFLCNENSKAVTCSGKSCGTVIDNCGISVNCGTCTNGYCSAGSCVACTQNSQCPFDQCNNGVCSSGNCTKQPVTGSPSCDSDPCLTGQTCSAGVCQGGGPKCSASQVCDSGTCADAHTCSSSNNTLMKLYYSTNSHGALWNDSIYSYSICYDEIFGISYIGTNPHDCTGTNKVLGLWNITNAHAEIPNFTTYTTNVCFGDLICRNVSGNCNLNESAVVSLYNINNSHISDRSDGDYPIKICCSSNQARNTQNYWTNMMGSGINQTDVKDTVMMTVTGRGLLGKTINFSIYKESGGLVTQNPILGNIFTIDAVNDISVGQGKWTPNDTGIYFFNATILNSDGSIYSYINSKDVKPYGKINVTSPANDSSPKTSISGPVDGMNYSINDTINFAHSTVDIDDDLNLSWDIDEGNLITFSNVLSNQTGNATHNYTKFGTKIIRLTANEMTRNLRTMNISRIFIHRSGLNAFAIVDSPDYHNISLSSGIYTLSGMSSYIDNCSYAGCPTVGIAPCYNITTVSNGNLTCREIASSSMLNFTWTIDGVADTVHKDNTPFQLYLTGPGYHTINLAVSTSSY